MYELKTNQDGKSDDKASAQQQQQQGRGANQLQAGNPRLQDKPTRTKPGFIVAEHRTKKRYEKTLVKKKKIHQSKFKSKLVNSRSTAKGFFKNRQMGKASKKDWDTDIAYITNIFAFLTGWLNLIRIDAKLGQFIHRNAVNWAH